MRTVGCALPIVAALLIGCAGPAVRVTGDDKSDPTWHSGQSESVVNFSGSQNIITVSDNDETDTQSTIKYTQTDRRVKVGASLLGWSYSTNGGASWTHGGKLAPTNGWSVLWGDPSITNDFADARYVFIANLAVPNSKMPSSGVISGYLDPPDQEAYLGGACIARSEDGGIHFAIAQCVTDNSDFYDGSSIVAAGSSYDRRVFAAFRDVDANKIDVWSAPNDTGTFTLMPNPFPGMTIVSHPRLRFDRDSDSLYVAAINNGDNKVYVSRYVNSWGSPAVASMSMVVNPDIQFANRTLRTGYQFSFDVGTPSQNGNDDVRFAYTMWDNASQRYYIRGSFCSLDLSKCYDAPEWGTTPGNFRLTGDQFNPNVVAFRGFFNIRPVWKLIYMTREDDPTGNTIKYRAGNLFVLADGVREFIPFDLWAPNSPSNPLPAWLVCGDQRGYWGDYNEPQFAGVTQDSAAEFMLAFTDSSEGCDSQWEFTSRDVHVSSIVIQ
jgi:hypothetical protein